MIKKILVYIEKKIGITKMHWINGDKETLPLRCVAQIRYHQEDQWATIRKEGNSWVGEFDAPQWAASPGQFMVLYSQTGECLGGGIISDM